MKTSGEGLGVMESAREAEVEDVGDATLAPPWPFGSGEGSIPRWADSRGAWPRIRDSTTFGVRRRSPEARGEGKNGDSMTIRRVIHTRQRKFKP
jgi:hypothetical protein